MPCGAGGGRRRWNDAGIQAARQLHADQRYGWRRSVSAASGRMDRWTPSMALCLAASLVETKGFDPADQLERYLRWWREGYMSSNGECFDIGNTVRQALTNYRLNGRLDSGPTSPDTAGNGSIMRLAPGSRCSLGGSARDAIEFSGKSSLTTHGATACVDACRYFGGLIWAALQGHGKEEILSVGFSPSEDGWQSRPSVPGNRGDRFRLFQAQKSAGDSRDGLRRAQSRGGLVGFSQQPGFQGRLPAGRQPRRRR